MPEHLSKQDLLALAARLTEEGETAGNSDWGSALLYAARRLRDAANPPLLAGVWRHIKSGHTYTVGGLCHMQNSAEGRALDGDLMVRYYRDNTWYVRPVKDFRERFVPDPTAAGLSPHKLAQAELRNAP